MKVQPSQKTGKFKFSVSLMQTIKKFLVFLSVSAVFALFETEIKLLARRFSCDPECVFNYSEINATTIEFFPKCDVVCGLLLFNSYTDLTESQLKDAFANMKSMYGGVVIENSNLTSLTFFGPKLNIDCSYYGIHIRNNENLTDVSKLTEFKFIPYYNPNFACQVNIANNKKLSMDSSNGSICDVGNLATVVDITTNGNLKDCACSALDQYSNCTAIFGGLKFSNITKIPDFSKITEIRGTIIIENTSLESLDFLKNLKSHKFKKGTVALDIKNNPNLTRLGISLTTKYTIQHSEEVSLNSYILANFENLHPDFCVTIEEMSFFLENQYEFKNFHGKYCMDRISSNICIFKNMRSLENNCTHILGNLVVESGDENHMPKLYYLKYLFGALIIKNTTLEISEYLDNLQYIAYLEEDLPVIRVEGNRKLKEFSLPYLTYIITKGDKYGIASNNPDMYWLVDQDVIKVYNEQEFSEFCQNNVCPGCPGDKVHVLEMDFYKNCETLVGGLVLKDDMVPGDIDKLSNLADFFGELEVANTSLTNLSFLGNMIAWNLEKELVPGMILANIHHNPNMKILGWDAFQYVHAFGLEGEFTMNLEKLHPDFCLTISEVMAFLKHKTKFRYLDAKLCDFNQTDHDFKICHFEGMRKLKKNCKYLIGNVLIDRGDEEYVEKLTSVFVIFGTVTVRKTNLDSLWFLWFSYMANLNSDSPLITVADNKKLKDFIFNRLEAVISRGQSTVVINQTGIFSTTKECMEFQWNTGTNVTYNGGNCRMIDRIASGTGNPWNISLYSIFVVWIFLY